jgi:GAF domain-containing protein
VARGDLNAQAPVETQSEIAQLAEAFNSMTAQLRQLIGSLEEQIKERTAELILSMEVGQRAAAIRELDQLLPTISQFIHQRFNFNHIQVYLVDDLGQNLILRANTGTADKQSLDHYHSLPIDRSSIVGQVTIDGQPIVIPGTEINDIYAAHPLLSTTRSELAIPLKVEGRVIGVLDMQSDQANAFTESNLTVFEAMATQLAISIDSAQQWMASQEAQRRAEEAVRRLTRESWAERLSSRQASLGFVYDLSTVLPVSAHGSESTNGGSLPSDPQSTLGQTETTDVSLPVEESESQNEISVSLLVQNQPIGQLSIQKPADRALSGDEQAFLSSIAQHLAQKAENLRLFEETQQRATREQIARQITDKIRASRDIETALKTAAAELSKALNTARAVAALKIDPQASEQESSNQ